jgi:hypothetical protein
LTRGGALNQMISSTNLLGSFLIFVTLLSLIELSESSCWDDWCRCSGWASRMGLFWRNCADHCKIQGFRRDQSKLRAKLKSLFADASKSNLHFFLSASIRMLFTRKFHRNKSTSIHLDKKKIESTRVEFMCSIVDGASSFSPFAWICESSFSCFFLIERKSDRRRGRCTDFEEKRKH